MRVSVARPNELAAAELSRWREIQAASAGLENPFLCPEFTVALANVRSNVYCALVEDAGQIVGFFPFQRSRFGIGQAAGLGLTDCQGFVVGDDVEIDPRRLVRECGLAVWEYDRLLARAGFSPSPRTRWRSLAVDLSHGFEHYLRGREDARGKLIADTQRKLRKLERDAGALMFAYDPRDPAALRRVMQAKSAQYRRTGLRDRFAEPSVVRLVEALHDMRTANFALLVPTLSEGGTWIAGNIMLRYRGTLSGWFPAYDPTYGRYSPGMLHRLKCLEAAASHGVRRVELGREGQPHKERWATDETILFEGAIEQPTVTALVRRAQREPVRILRTAVVKNPRLYRTARRTLARLRRHDNWPLTSG
jgi:CelD/BcsL family acetyltransferase involved in cellulose biosynthesis